MGKKSNFWREHRPNKQTATELDLRPKHIGLKASQMKFKGFSGPAMQIKAFLRQPPNFKVFSRLYEPCEQIIINVTLESQFNMQEKVL